MTQVLWRKNRWRIELFDPSKPWRGVFIANGVNAYRATEYENGSVAYDFPERVPKYVQKVVSKNITKWVRGPA